MSVTDFVYGEIILRSVLWTSFMYVLEGFQPRVMDGCYVRFKDIPENEMSVNHSNGKVEPGVSVYEAAVLDDCLLPKLSNVRAETLFPVMNIFECAANEMPAYLVRGNPVGRGSDGEVVLRNVSIVKKLVVKTKAIPYILLDHVREATLYFMLE